MNFLITGAAGFLGSALANRLAEEDHQVRGLDDLSTGEPQALSDDVHFTRGDVNDRPKLWTLLQDVDCVYHLAARVSVSESLLYPREYNAVNVGGTVSLMEAMRDVGVGRVVLISSGAVYGDQQEQPLREDAPPSPRSPYAVSKLTGEYYCRVFQLVYSLPTVCLRYFNVYGPRQDPNSQYAAVIPKFITRITSSQGPVIYGDGEQSRDFTYVMDVVEATILAAESEVTGIFNIGTGKSITINQLAKLCIEMLSNYYVNPIHEEPRKGDIRDSLANITGAKNFGYSPKYDLEMGLHETIRSFTNEA